MFCPYCKKDVKPGSEKRSMSHGGQILIGVGVIGSIVSLWQEKILLGIVILGVIFIGAGLVLGQMNPLTVCPACGMPLLPENPFDDSEL